EVRSFWAGRPSPVQGCFPSGGGGRGRSSGQGVFLGEIHRRTRRRCRRRRRRLFFSARGRRRSA
ncbi:unnamed protein product, partial [Ectocarpus sp. 4 AP-2014]